MALVWQSILIFNKHLEQRSALMPLKCFETKYRVDTARQRRRQLERDKDKQTEIVATQMLRRTTLTV